LLIYIYMYPIILAGGTGTRLWPVSRKESPKQIQPFLDGETLLLKTYKRLINSAPTENIFLSTNISLFNEAKKQLKDLPLKNFVLEPVKRDTAGALGLSLLKILKRDKDGVFVYINSDAYIKNEKEYDRLLRLGESIIQKNPEKTLLIGINPTYPETGYGYIEVGNFLKKFNEDDVFIVNSFKEKPDLETAKRYLESAKYLWNPTLIIARADYFLSLYKKHLPEMYDILMKINEAIDTDDEDDVIADYFSQITPISIDNGILEKEKDMIVMPGNFGWTDIGHWRAILDILSEDGKDNVELTNHIHTDSFGNFIYSLTGKLTATIGLENMIIVETEDALLICPKNRAQDVKKIVQKLEEREMKEYL